MGLFVLCKRIYKVGFDFVVTLDTYYFKFENYHRRYLQQQTLLVSQSN